MPLDGLSIETWIDILSQLRMTNPQLWRPWFPNLQPLTLAGGVLTIAAANESQLAYLTDNCTPAFVDAAQTSIGRLISTHFVVKGPQSASRVAPASSAAPPLDDPPEPLVDDYRFANFAIGPSNRLAHASALAICESPGTMYNPLFIHGNRGVGKTHLLQAICHALHEVRPTAIVTYLTCEKFVTGFMNAIESGEIEPFRDRYRLSDILVIDDVQRLSDHERTREDD